MKCVYLIAIFINIYCFKIINLTLAYHFFLITNVCDLFIVVDKKKDNLIKFNWWQKHNKIIIILKSPSAKSSKQQMKRKEKRRKQRADHEKLCVSDLKFPLFEFAVGMMYLENWTTNKFFTNYNVFLSPLLLYIYL